jgi:sialate O-acetylesterase
MTMQGTACVKVRLLALVSVIATAPVQAAEVGFAHVFSDHAVLQRDQPVTVWGTAGPAQKLTVSLNGHVANGTADKLGKWRVQLPRMPAGGPYTLAVAADGKSASLNDIMIGDVYLCSGQSNMEFAVRASTNAFAAMNGPTNNNLRFLNIPKASEFAPQDDIKQPASWQVAGRDTVGDASAVCYYMARSLQASYNVPVGFINASWGGTTIQGWISPTALRTMGDYTQGVAAVQEHAANAAKALKQEEERQEAWWDAHDPAARRQRAWIAPGFDDSSWPRMTPASSWKASGIGEFRNFDGVAWLRTAVDLTQAQATKANRLQLGPVDTFDTTWVNGVRVGGSSTDWLWRDYAVPAGVFKAGRNVIVMRVLGGGHGGGPTGQPGNRGVKTADGQFIALPLSWKYQLGSAIKGASQPAAPWDVPTSLTTLYNGMIAPLAGFGFKLAAWYQGESNALAAAEYRTLLPLLMNDWRARLGEPGLPFLIVQLPGYGAVARKPGQSAWAELREAQELAVENDPRAALAVIIDVGDRSDIHPTQKTIVGERLARAARAVVYGESIAPGGPQAVSARRDGNDIVVEFKNTNGALATYSSDKAIGFEICARDNCRFADATVSGDHVVLPGANAPGVTRVRYAWADAPFVNLFSEDDLPAAPFRMDVN